MPVYIYHAEKGQQVLKGTLRAQSVQGVNQYLRTRNMDPIYVVEKPLLPFAGGVKKVKNRDLLNMTRQLAFLLQSGVSLVQALGMLAETITGATELKRCLLHIRKRLEAGSTFSRALKGFPHIFSAFYVNMIACSEETGLMDKVLNDLANYMEKMEEIKSKVKAPMVYIGIVLLISLSISGGIIMFVVPAFESLYSGAGSKLPFLTQSLVDLSRLLRDKWPIILGLLVGIVLVVRQYLQTDKGKDRVGILLSALPVLGPLRYNGDLARFCRAFETLLKSGVNFLEALDVGQKLVGVKKLQYGFREARASVSKGKSFTKGLSSSGAFPRMMVGMTAIGEESGRLGDIYSKLAEYYEGEVDTLVSSLVKMVEPIMITVVGAIVGTLILALYLPIFRLGDVVI